MVAHWSRMGKAMVCRTPGCNVPLVQRHSRKTKECVVCRVKRQVAKERGETKAK
jgi:hypothetical protein